MEKTTAQSVNTFYQEYMFGALRETFPPFDKIGFFNLGYWKGVADSIELAQINLIETLIGFLEPKSGVVLDVACGKGASSKYLTKYFDSKSVTGINISEKQLEVCKVIAPECNFRLMDATKLEFDDLSVDHVMCIEAAIHFDTRRKFFEECYRVLKKGGRLAASDILCDYDALENNINGSKSIPERLKGAFIAAHPRENYLPSLDAYTQMLLSIGFSYVRVEDSTEFSIRALENHWIRRAEKEFARTRDYDALKEIMSAAQPKVVTAGCMVYGIK